jgi:hypothetical protein
MLSFFDGYESGVSPSVRVRNVFREYWDFTALQWVVSESADTRLNYAESENGDGTSLYVVEVPVPLGGPYIQEAVLPSGEVLGCDTTAIDSTLSESVAVTPPTIVEIRQELDTNSVKLANLDVAVSSRSTYNGGQVASVLGSVGSVAGAVGSVAAPVTVGINQDKTGYSLSIAGILAIWNQATGAAGILVNTIGAKVRDLVLGVDNKVMVSADPQDLSATLQVNAKVVGDKTGYALTSAYDAAKSASSQTSVSAIPTSPLLETDTRLDHLDANISSIPTDPLLLADYTEPDNAAIASVLLALQHTTYGLERLDTEIDAISITLSSVASGDEIQTLLDRLSVARAGLLDNLQYLTEAPGLTVDQVNTLTEARDEARLSRQMQTNKAIIANDGLSVTIYADDGLTPLWVFSIPDNKHRIPA